MPDPLIIRELRIHPVHIPFPQTIQWGGHEEAGTDYLLLEILTEAGWSGLAEGTVKVNWNGMTLRSMALCFDDIFAPRLCGLDAADQATIGKVLRRIPENRLAKSMIDIACWDLRAQYAGRPLWQLWNGASTVPVSWTVTRQKPVAMAQQAASRVREYGFKMLKVKTGQGFETDYRAIEEIRQAVGDSVSIYVDSNGAYSRQETPAYVSGLKDRGIFLAEDPCKFRPDREFEELKGRSPLPLMVDNDCSSIFDAAGFLDRGAEAISIKIQKSGISDSWEIIKMARERGTKTHIGFLGESSLGSLAALQLAAAMPDRNQWLPAETTFFLTLPNEFMHTSLRIVDGQIELPAEPSAARLVDWKKVATLCP